MKKLASWVNVNLLKVGVTLLVVTVAVYPKFPVIAVPNTWVYVRFEDFLVSIVGLLWIFQFLRKKVKITSPLTKPIFVYIIAAGVATGWAVIFKEPNSEFFPHLAFLHWLRRIEYFAIFFFVYSTVDSWKDFKDYFFVYLGSLWVTCLYGLGQRYIYNLPAFSTMNEEFAKGIPLYLQEHSRVLSTFAGHYDFAAFLVLGVALFGSFYYLSKKKRWKLIFLASVILAFYMLLLTFSRVSFGAYMVAVVLVILLQKINWSKKAVTLVLVLVVSLMGVKNSEEFSDRFEKMIAFNEDIVKKFSIFNNRIPTASSSAELLPVSDEVPKRKEGTSSAKKVIVIKEGVKFVATPTPRPRPPKKEGEEEEVVVIEEERKAIYVDRSTSTRFDAEWPRAINSFLKNPLFGTGYSSITLATDNDYLRLLGETGLAGFVTFMYIFWNLWLFIKEKLKKAKDKLSWGVLVALISVSIAMLANAFLIDVFEASKVAMSFWGIIGLLLSYFKLKDLKRPIEEDF